ncbi:MAG TPA: PrsW family glutamic-type intramembrane protease [Gemmatimonadales bacterium]|nr:PrsW family glutamic-type intramembrane protease [Gemmatimonadales bacterium]
MTTILEIAVSILPAFLFLGSLVLIDSYKLVGLRAILLSVAAGVAAGLAGYAVNVWLRPALDLDPARYSVYVAPVVEESLKAAWVVHLLHRSKVGFVVDAAIHGFGIGTGFAFIENVYYLRVNPDAVIWTWFVRGFGTAIMHGGSTAIMAMVSRTLHNRLDAIRPHLLLPGLSVAVVLHSLYNSFLLQPLLATALIVLVFPYLSFAVFQHSERETKAWLGAGFDTDQELLRAVRTGQVSRTPAGKYLRTLRSRFSAEVIVDMMCLLRLRAELGIRAKGILLMREAGFDATPDPGLAAKFDELRYLERSIGRTGLLALGPFLHTSTRDLWQLNMLSER